MRPIRLVPVLLMSLPALCLSRPGTAQEALKGGPSPAPAGASVYFVDVKDGAVIPPNTTIHFGLRGMGIAPAGIQRDNAGHHHLLVDTELPNLSEPIPNDFNHLHFGAGQTEAELNLPPGEHTLQLLLADHKHIPHTPPILSERIRIVVREGAPVPGVAARKPGTRHPSPKGAKVYIASPPNGAVVPRTVLVRFGLIGMGVAPAGVVKANTGHHHLLIDTPLPPPDRPIPNDFNHLHFGAGQTEARVTLTPGRHTLQLLLADEDHVPHDPPIYSKPIRVLVTVSGRPPRARVARPVRP
ncbi:DUF4399 domain-containing protein [Methylobacterium nodulans]|uniref:DUF4399 domain-containing protein n=1 Tax=Methylobacterium nodulans (strain LMG 21967 / CNCM I-2342 / ORS 2060) TaxID=460265 RepID=B8ILI0_METNO|nr:DUF4399 domain-containing protein [Methylobacterium nodulans]ACL60179.1 conserved hypothetical protein [Methylobacterium nodulans ORS 2060]